MSDSLRCLVVLAWLCGAFGVAAPALSDTYPSKRIRIVLAYSPGGAGDLVARTVAQKLASAFGQAVVVDNIPGGASNIGSEVVARARADGYTLLMGSPAHAVNVSLYAKMPYDVLKDLAAIVLIGKAANILVIHPSLPLRSIKDLLALAKSRPGELTYASAGIASSGHLSGELLQTMAHIKLLHVPYRGGSPAAVDLMAGNVSLFFSSLPSALGLMRAGKLRALGVTSLERATAAPEVATIAESGVPGYELVTWHGLFAPAGTPQNVIGKLNTEVIRGARADDARTRLESQGINVAGGTSADFLAFLKDEIAKYALLVKNAGIKPE